jgi:glycosyltransferase involved in cell wall biosynthesis
MSANSMPVVSVIMPFYNTPVAYLHEAVHSVLAQSYKRCELLLVDDGSTPPCTDSALSLARLNPQRVRYLEHPGHDNRGLSASRNLGLLEARGEYVAFLDADDVWLPHKLAQQVPLLNAQPQAGMLYGNTLYWYSWNPAFSGRKRDFVPRLGFESEKLVQPPALLPLFLRGRVAVPCTSSILLRRSTLEDIGGFEESFEGMYEDQVLYAKMCVREPVFVSTLCWDRYRQHADSMCAVNDPGKTLQARRRYLQWLETFLVEQRIDDPGVWRALREEQWVVRHPMVRRPLEKLRWLIWSCSDALPSAPRH